MNIKALHAATAGPIDADGPEDWRPPRRRRWGLRLALLGLLLLVGLAVGYRFWVRSVRARLDATLAQLRREGEPVYPQDLIRPDVPADDNAVFDLRAASMLIDTTGAAWKNYQAVTLDSPSADEAVRIVAKVLEPAESRKALALARVARGKRSADWQMRMRTPMVSTLLPDLNLQRNMSELCRAAATKARSRKDHGAAIEYARDMLGVSRAMQSYPALVSHMTAIGISESAAEQVEQSLPGLRVARPDPAAGTGSFEPGEKPATPEQVRALIADLLDESDYQRGFIQALRDERAMELDTALAIVEGKLDFAAVFAGSAAGGGSLGPAMLLPKPLILTDARILVDYNTAVIKALQASPDVPAYRLNAPADPFGPTSGQPLRGHAVARLLLPAYERAITNHFRVLAERRMAAAGVAVKWYQADHDGKPPATLEELAPKYLPAAPADPFSPGGKPLRYVAGAGQLIVYSVGENGIDDGGSDALMSGRRLKQNRWDHLDAVLSMSAKPVEVPAEKPQENSEAKPNTKSN
jgi:hypothetical protein